MLKEKKTKKKKTEAKVSTSTACCYGCGAPLQTIELDAPGYVDNETYELVSFFLGFVTYIDRRLLKKLKFWRI